MGLAVGTLPLRAPVPDRDSIFIKIDGGDRLILTLYPTVPIEQYKRFIEASMKIPFHSQSLTFEGRELYDLSLLPDYGIGPDATLYLFIQKMN